MLDAILGTMRYTTAQLKTMTADELRAVWADPKVKLGHRSRAIRSAWMLEDHGFTGPEPTAIWEYGAIVGFAKEPEERPTLWGLRERILQMFPKVTIRINAQGRHLSFDSCTVYVSAGKAPKIAVKFDSAVTFGSEKARYFAFEDEAKAANYIASIHNWRAE